MLSESSHMTTRVSTIAVCFHLISAFAALSASAQTVWTRQHVNASGDLNVVYFTSGDRGWVAGDGGFLAQTRDGGGTWTPYPLGMTENVNEIYFRNEDNGYLVAGKRMFITHDGGR